MCPKNDVWVFFCFYSLYNFDDEIFTEGALLSQNALNEVLTL